jgi:spore maturation protein CgeB
VRPASEWRRELERFEVPERVVLEKGRGGEATLKLDGVYLHSRYRPTEEAARFIDSADLDLERPVVVIGIGLGYHVRELLKRAVRDLVVVEPEPAIAKLALENVLAEADFQLAIGEVDELLDASAFQDFAARQPQLLVHPATAHVHPSYTEQALAKIPAAGLCAAHLNVAVVGPLYGGSLPIAGYLAKAFHNLGHRTRFIDHSATWPLYDEVRSALTSKRATSQLTAMLTQFLGEWSYAQVAEFGADICLVMAQAPVGPAFAQRLTREGVVTAFWFVENWRHLTYWQEIAQHYDAFFHIQPGDFDARLDAAGCQHHPRIQTGCDPDVHRPIELTSAERETYACDMSFAGAGYYNRTQVFQGLTDYDLKIWGVEWHSRELRNVIQEPQRRFDAEDFARITAGSKININLHSSATHPGIDPRCDALNPRVFEIAACGGFQLCDPCAGLEDFFDLETEVPVYRSLSELRDRIAYYLENPDEREAVSQRARERALRDHTYEKRAQEMLDYLTEHFGARILRKGVRVQRTVAEMAVRLGADSELATYLSTLPAETPFSQDGLRQHLSVGRAERSRPEAIVAYLQEVRNFAEGLLASD